MKIEMKPIGVVINTINEPISPAVIKEQQSIIEIEPQYLTGLKDVSEYKYLDIVFYFHQNEEVEMVVNSKKVHNKGVFATRVPSRPNHIGVTTVELIKVEGNHLYVKGLDAINQTPVLDIKCCDTSSYDVETVHKSILAENPRIDINRCINSTHREDLLYKAGQLHGHICPGIAMGVLAGAEIMKMIFDRREDPFDYCLIAQQPNCVLDGLMFVTGFTPGKRKLIFEPGDKMEYRIVDNEGRGWLISSSDHNRTYVDNNLSDEDSKFERALQVLELDFFQLFDVEELC